MAHIELNALSVCLSGTFDAHIFSPEPQQLQERKDFPVIWFIHEDGSSPFTLLRYTDILERMAVERGIFVIAPTVGHSLCTDMVWGTQNEKFLGEECIKIFRFLYPLSTKKENNVVLGIKSGGYGALKLAVDYAETFGTGISIEGELDIAGKCLAPESDSGFSYQTKASLEAIFGNLTQVPGSRHDLYALVKKPGTKLRLLCSTTGKMYSDNLRMVNMVPGIETDFADYGTGREAIAFMLKKVYS